MILVKNVTCIGEKRNACRILIGQNERKRSLGRCRHISKYIRIDFNVTGWKLVDWIPLAWDETNGGFF